ncbi:MAG: hypothetical protein ABS68_08940 [Niastella sp. SCN 39-18]|nr:hypothetical protein [Sphingobacteriales bacterium]ODT52231.1 MAG: hypothetical protein ABS68_08940 [Niastella sp. SCN 39-18]OJW10484.1 MAG: hypothetical protein BGO53_09945 [Sphingobacteriales bacterium 39-19]
MAGNIHSIPVIIGATKVLVSQRELRNKYQTNRDIKTWSCYFLLKSLTTSGLLQNWIRQKQDILEFLQCNEQTFRTRLKDMQRLGLVEILPGYCLQLTSYKKASSVLGIDYQGTVNIKYDDTVGKNYFAYLLTADEIRRNQETQRSALIFHLDKNPLLLNLLLQCLVNQGCDERRLVADPVYLQERLLQLQVTTFKEGSAIIDEIMSRRADVNRGVKKIAEDHGYKHPRSVTYLKRVLQKLGICKVVKRFVLSDARCRRYFTQAGVRKDGYMWLKDAKQTRWNLCDQLIINNKNFKKNETENFSPASLAA